MPDELGAVKPTCALDYLFARRAVRGPNGPKDVVNIWELGGGLHLSDLVEVPINESTIHKLTLVIFLNLAEVGVHHALLRRYIIADGRNNMDFRAPS